MQAELIDKFSKVGGEDAEVGAWEDRKGPVKCSIFSGWMLVEACASWREGVLKMRSSGPEQIGLFGSYSIVVSTL